MNRSEQAWELRAIFRGQVQGVGFRWTVADHAETFHLTGTVKNLGDGSVEVIAHGPKNQLEAFCKAIEKDSGSARITSSSCEYRQSERQFADFRIITH